MQPRWILRWTKKHLFSQSACVSTAWLLVPVLLGGCRLDRPTKAGRLPEQGYLWQRAWTPAVTDAIQLADKHMDGVVVLGAEIVWDRGKPQALGTNLSWPTLQHAQKSCALALRIAPYPGPFSEGDPQINAIADTAKSFLKQAQSHHVVLSEFQIDFDCAQGKLSGYCSWVRSLAKTVHPTRLVITTLPAWLNEPEFPALVKEADGYVLQVHSVPTAMESGHAVLCDPTLARKWVTEASRLGMPFSVALPTYSCLAGYDPSGKLIGVAMDSVEASWPPETRAVVFTTNAGEVASLVREWNSARPPGLQAILWYRLPVATDLRNWRWATLLAVMEGRTPAHRLKVIREGENPVDLSIVNAGEDAEELDCEVILKWKDARLTAFDVLPGWTVSKARDKIVFATDQAYALRLSSGAKLGIGWLRFEKTPDIQIDVSPHGQPSP